jgi:hypothetical protein
MSCIKMTNRVRLLVAVGITTILVLSVGVWHTQAQARTPIPIFGWPIGAAPVEFTQAQVNVSESRSVVRAFVATDSLSPNCLVTFRDSNFAQAGTSVFCGPREQGGHKGVMVTVFFPGDVPPDDANFTFTFQITLYHEFARRYAAPVLFTGQ